MPNVLNPTVLWESPSVTVWVSPLDVSTAVLDELQKTLSADEQKRASGYGRKNLRDAFLVRRGVLRVLLGRHLNCPPHDVPIEVNAFGKPVLASGTAHFNVSSSHGVAVWAISSVYLVGVDIERIDETPPGAALIEDTFSQAEQAVLNAASGAARFSAFYRGWTGKEACAKATGFGLSLPLAQFETLPGASRANPTTIITSPLGSFAVTSLPIVCSSVANYASACALMQTVD